MFELCNRSALKALAGFGLALAIAGPGAAKAASLTAAQAPLVASTVADPLPPKHPHRAGTHLAALGKGAVGIGDPAAYQLAPTIAAWYHERGATAPLTDHPIYCHGYGCEFQTSIAIDDADLATLRRIFAGHSGTAVEERKAISEAVRWWERHASPLLGGPPRQHGSDMGHAHHPGATDCIDEATNSTTILVFLERRGFLKHHVVERPQSRGMIVNAHSTAIIREIGGSEWAVDMWMHDMGEAPDIMPAAEWQSQA